MVAAFLTTCGSTLQMTSKRRLAAGSLLAGEFPAANAGGAVPASQTSVHSRRSGASAGSGTFSGDRLDGGDG
jgi:hypothetical protein